jgi:cobalt/nickel transport system ATP-binding protein
MLFELKDVSYSYPDGTPALVDVSLSICRGSRIALLGANGSGKSTLLRLLNGLVEPTSGLISFEDASLSEKSLKSPEFQFHFRSRVGYVFQDADAQLFNQSVWEEVAFGPRQLGLQEDEIARRVEETLLFLGISHLAERPPFRLSGGEKRKVAIAAVLSMNPEVILFDEPIAGLDPRTQTWLVQTLNQLQASGKTTIVSSHNLQVLPSIADTAIVLSEQHQVICVKPLEEVLGNQTLLEDANLIWRTPVVA